MAKTKDLSALVARYEAKIEAKPEKAASLQLKLNAKIAKQVEKGNTVLIDGQTVTAYTLGQDSGGTDGGTTPTPVGSTFTLTASTPTGDYSSLGNAATVTLAGDNDPLDGTSFTVTGSAYDDTFIVREFLEAVISGGSGTDTVDFSDLTLNDADEGVDIVLNGGMSSAGSATNLSLSSIENVVGTDEDDVIYGGSGANVITGGEGADDLQGGEGNDTFVFADEDAFINAGDTANDSINGGGGTDKIRITEDRVDFSATARDTDATSIESVEFTAADIELTIGNSTNAGTTRLFATSGDRHGGSTWTATASSTEDTLVIDANAGDVNLSNVNLVGFEIVEIDDDTNEFVVNAATLSAVSEFKGASDTVLFLDEKTAAVGATYDLRSAAFDDQIDAVARWGAADNTTSDTVILDQDVIAQLTDNYDEVDRDVFGDNAAAVDTYWNVRDTVKFVGIVDFSTVEADGNQQLDFGIVEFDSRLSVHAEHLDDLGDTQTFRSTANGELVIRLDERGGDDIGGATNNQDVAALDLTANITLFSDIDTLTLAGMDATDVLTIGSESLDGLSVVNMNGVLDNGDALSAAVDLSELLIVGVRVLGVAADNDIFVMNNASIANVTDITDSELRLAANETYDLSGISTAAAGALVRGTSGADTISSSGRDADIVYILGSGNDSFTSGSTTVAQDVRTDAGNDTVSTSSGADIIYGGADADTISVGNGADTVWGGAGADSIDLTETIRANDVVAFTIGSIGGVAYTNDDTTIASYDTITGFFASTAGAADTIEFYEGDDAQAGAPTAIATTQFTDGDVVSLDVSGSAVEANTSAGSILATVAGGVITLTGSLAARINTLAEWIDVAQTVIADASNAGAGDVVGFVFGSDSYVYYDDTLNNADANGADALIKLAGVTITDTAFVA